MFLSTILLVFHDGHTIMLLALSILLIQRVSAKIENTTLLIQQFYFLL